jgi:hypothetical protein
MGFLIGLLLLEELTPPVLICVLGIAPRARMCPKPRTGPSDLVPPVREDVVHDVADASRYALA